MEYKHLMNNKNLSILTEKLDAYEAQINEDNSYIDTLTDKINQLEDALQEQEG